MAKAAARAVPKFAARAAKATRAVATKARTVVSRCNSFAPDTPVVLADGSTRAISEISVGDYVLAVDPDTGQQVARPVIDVIVGYGTKHLVDIDLDPTDPDVLTATAEHPIWVNGRGWTVPSAMMPEAAQLLECA
jgi:hypothetical protein